VIGKWGYYLNHRGVGPPKAYMVSHDDEFHRVSEGCVSLDKNRFTGNEAHFHEPAPERPGSPYMDDTCEITFFNISQGHWSVSAESSSNKTKLI
jgi:hypothetical protein